MTVNIQIDTVVLDTIAANLELNRDQLVSTIALEIEGRAKQLAPVDTSALVNSIYTVTDKSDGYGDAAAAARAADPDAKTAPHPPPHDGEARVGPSVEYAAYLELGTSKMAAHPYLLPAVKSVEAQLTNGKTIAAGLGLE